MTTFLMLQLDKAGYSFLVNKSSERLTELLYLHVFATLFDKVTNKTFISVEKVSIKPRKIDSFPLFFLLKQMKDEIDIHLNYYTSCTIVLRTELQISYRSKRRVILEPIMGKMCNNMAGSTAIWKLR